MFLAWKQLIAFCSPIYKRQGENICKRGTQMKLFIYAPPCLMKLASNELFFIVWDLDKRGLYSNKKRIRLKCYEANKTLSTIHTASMKIHLKCNCAAIAEFNQTQSATNAIFGSD